MDVVSVMNPMHRMQGLVASLDRNSVPLPGCSFGFTGRNITLQKQSIWQHDNLPVPSHRGGRTACEKGTFYALFCPGREHFSVLLIRNRLCPGGPVFNRLSLEALLAPNRIVDQSPMGALVGSHTRVPFDLEQVYH